MQQDINDHPSEVQTNPETTSQQASTVKKGDYIILKGYPCRITDTPTSNRKDQMKTNFVGVDIFTGKKHEDSLFSTSDVNVLVPIYKEYQLVSILQNMRIC